MTILKEKIKKVSFFHFSWSYGPWTVVLSIPGLNTKDAKLTQVSTKCPPEADEAKTTTTCPKFQVRSVVFTVSPLKKSLHLWSIFVMFNSFIRGRTGWRNGPSSHKHSDWLSPAWSDSLTWSHSDSTPLQSIGWKRASISHSVVILYWCNLSTPLHASLPEQPKRFNTLHWFPLIHVCVCVVCVCQN